MQQPAMSRVLDGVASQRVTLAGLLLLAGGVLMASRGGGAWWVAAPLLLLAGNLVAAIAVNGKLRRQGPLLGLHLSLLLLAALAGYGHLTAFHGRLELSEGQAFDPALVVPQRVGPWHRMSLPAGLFEQGPIAVAYRAGMVRGDTRSNVQIADEAGRPRQVALGDDRPLVYGGYRFYTTPNKGFAVRLRWEGSDGGVERGAVHLPSYPMLALEQRSRWQTPAGVDLEVRLLLPEPPPEGRPWVLRGVAEGTRLQIVESGNERSVAPGETLVVAGGKLTFEGVGMWMGYRLFYDPTLPWLFACALCAVLCLAWHFQRKLWSLPLPGAEPVVESPEGRSAHGDLRTLSR